MDDWPELERIRVAWNAGVRARDWPVDGLPSLYKKVEGKWQAAYVHQVGYYSALDRGLFLQARLHIARAVQEATQWSWEDDEFVPHLLFERLYLFAYLQENFEDYLYCLEDFNYELDYAHTTRARAEAAVFVARGDMDSANAKVEQARIRIAEENPDLRPNIRAELDWLYAILKGPPPNDQPPPWA